ncbi:MAG: hypothetical protein Q7J68_04665 [Thermoplasmata archaeon]|nr:hypothetical protein [Thermoplasmata archaeon]
MKHIQPKTMMVMKAALSANSFSQLGLRKLCGNRVSVGQVSKVITELQRLGYVERSTGPDGSRYVLADPVGLLRYVALFRRMDELRAFRVKVAAHEELVIEELGGRGAVFCLGTAMARYSAYYRPGEVSFYADDPDGIKKYLETAQPGNTLVCCYGPAGPAMPPEGNFTDRVQTVIDMFCDGKGAYSKPLLRELWGVEI